MTAPLPTDPQDLLAELEELKVTIDAADEARDRRLALWVAARVDLDPTITFAKLAAASGLAEPYVIREVGKARPKSAKKPRARAAT